MRTLIFLLLWILPNAALAKQEVTGTSAPGSLHLEAKPAFPAYIRVLSKTFDEPSGNRALDAEETGQLVVRVRNEGLGKGKLTVKLTPLTGTEHLTFRRSLNVGEVDVDQTRTIRIPMQAGLDVETMRRDFRVEIVEDYYKDVIPFTFSFDTRAYDPPEFRVILKDYDDTREIMKRNNPDGSVEAGELIRVIANVQNVGSGEAEQAQAKVTIRGAGGEAHYRRDLGGSVENIFDLGKMPSGADRDVLFYFFTNPMFRGKQVNIAVDVTEARGRHEASKTLSFDIGQSVPTEEVLAVQSVQERRGKVSLVQAQLVDVDQVPSGSKTRLEHGIAIIFGIERYKHTFPAAYKNRDATVFYKYCKDVLGIPEERIYLRTDDDVTKGEFDYVFEPKGTSNEGWLKKRMKDPQQVRETDVFVYLGGHGFPDLSTGKPYFIPYDIRPEQATNGISMEALYQRLSEFNARSVMVFVESCFSGASDYEKGMKEQLLALNMNPVFPTLESPLVGKRMVVFTATSGKKPSNNRDDLKHGIFTYFLLKGLGGVADGNGDKTVTVRELAAYLSKQVPKKALEAPLDREQIPEIQPGLKVLGEMAERVVVRY